jgi:putative phosphotransacetylase
MKKVILEVSARHLHLSEKDLFVLFGKNYVLHKKKDLSQKGEFAAQETVDVVHKNKVLSCRIVGPTRKQTQVELSATDFKFLELPTSLRLSGDLKNTGGAVLVGPKAKIKLKQGLILAKRHLHIDPKTAQKWNLKNGQSISAVNRGERAVVFKNVIVRIGDFSTRLHLDTDEANASGLKNNDFIYLDI